MPKASTAPLPVNEYWSESCAYPVEELRRRAGFSRAWFDKARVTKPELFKVVNGNGGEVINGRELIEFLAEHPDLLNED